MEWFIAAAAIVALGVAAIAAAGGGGGMSREPVYDTYRAQLPDRPLTEDDILQARFGVAFRGYAMAQVDDLLERLGREIGERDARIAELTGGAGGQAEAQPLRGLRQAQGAEPVAEAQPSRQAQGAEPEAEPSSEPVRP